MGPALQNMTADALKEALEKRKEGQAIIALKGGDVVKPIAEKLANDEKLFAEVVYVTGTEAESNSLTIYKGYQETESYSGEWTEEKVSEFAAKARIPLFGQITEDNFEIYVEKAKDGLFWVCFDPTKSKDDVPKYSPSLAKAAEVNSEYPFVWLDITEFEAHAKEELGCSTYPTIVLQRGDLLGEREDTKVEKFVRSFSEKPEELTTEAVSEFFADVKSGKLEAAPEPDGLEELDADDAEDDGGDDEKQEEL